MKPRSFMVPCLSVAAVFAMTASSAFGAGAHNLSRSALVSYQIGEQDSTSNDAASSQNATNEASTAPVRLARFSYVSGNVTWRPSDKDDWSDASVNLPIRQGAQIWATGDARAEIQFDDGSVIRLGHGAVVTLQTLYSDTNGEFTEIQLNQGLVALRLRHANSEFQVDTTYASVKSYGPSKVRVGVHDGVEVAVQGGSAEAVGTNDRVKMSSGDYLYLDSDNSAFRLESAPDADTWDLWNDRRDRDLNDTSTEQYVPSNIAQVCGNLNAYGSWRNDPNYGEVWCPMVSDNSWRPYSDGRWVWVAPFGWTWVSNEAWGWAPYHYGSWYHANYGWCWVPGPSRQYWCPAVVHYSECDGNVAWCPLDPDEVRYPSQLSFGFAGNRSWLNFSIGGCAVYYPEDRNHCSPHPWNNRFVNRVTYVNVTNNYYGPVNNHDHYDDDHFVPKNARHSGVTTVALGDFSGHGNYHRESNDGSNLFLAGRGIGAPDHGDRPFSGPIAVKPTSESISAGRSFFTGRQPTGHDLDRPVFRAQLPTNIEAYAPPIHTFGHDNGFDHGNNGNQDHNTFPANNWNQNNGNTQPGGGTVPPRHGLGPQNNKQWLDQHGEGNQPQGNNQQNNDNQNHDTFPANNGNQNNGNQNNGNTQPGGTYPARHGFRPQDSKWWNDQHAGGNNQNTNQPTNNNNGQQGGNTGQQGWNNGQQGGNVGQQGGNNGQQGGNNGQQGGNNGQQNNNGQQGNWQRHDIFQQRNDNPPVNRQVVQPVETPKPNNPPAEQNNNDRPIHQHEDRTDNNKGTDKSNGDNNKDSGRSNTSRGGMFGNR